MHRGLLPRLNLELLAFHILLEFPGGTPDRSTTGENFSWREVII